MTDTFDLPRDGSGTHEWAEFTENIAIGCPAACLYCYAAKNAQRFKLRERDNWAEETLSKRAALTSYPKKDGVIMFPSSHDVTPFNIEAYLRIAKLMLAAGNRLLIVSKPRLECISRLVSELADYKHAILFRFTLGTLDEATAAHWEPGAATPAERIAALELAFKAGFRTSISAEPLLGGLETAWVLRGAVQPYVTDSIWIGKMNRIRDRVDLSVPENLARAIEIEEAQTDEEILRLHAALKHDPMVRWKDSIDEVLARSAGGFNAVIQAYVRDRLLAELAAADLAIPTSLDEVMAGNPAA